jgi:hypothetical protein
MQGQPADESAGLMELEVDFPCVRKNGFTPAFSLTKHPGRFSVNSRCLYQFRIDRLPTRRKQ